MSEKEDLINRLQQIVGRVPADARYFLSVLAHPDIIQFTKKYIDVMDVANRCQKYEHPWNCAQESLARHENITFGWLGATDSIVDERWCEPCRKRVSQEF